MIVDTNGIAMEAVAAAVRFSWNFTGIYTNPACFPTIDIYPVCNLCFYFIIITDISNI